MRHLPLITSLLLLVGCSTTPSPTPTPSVAVSPSPTPTPSVDAAEQARIAAEQKAFKKEVQRVLDKQFEVSKLNPDFTSDWDCTPVVQNGKAAPQCKTALLFPELGWNKLNEKERQTVIQWAEGKGASAIVVGMNDGNNGITLDREVWKR